jgi:thiol:disulfide interchange protein DsbD
MKKILLSFLLIFSANLIFAQIIKNPVNWTSSVKKLGDKTYQVVLVANIDKGWHMYSQTTPDGGPIPTKVTVAKNPLITTTNGFKENGKLEQKYEPLFGVNVRQYSDKVEFTQVVKTKALLFVLSLFSLLQPSTQLTPFDGSFLDTWYLPFLSHLYLSVAFPSSHTEWVI